MSYPHEALGTDDCAFRVINLVARVDLGTFGKRGTEPSWIMMIEERSS